MTNMSDYAVFNSEVREQYQEHLLENFQRTDRIFGWLLPAQWMFAVFCAIVISPLAWEGTQNTVHIHVWAAVFLGGLLTTFPVFMTYMMPGHTLTRLSVAIAQAMYSALLIHLMGGRIEAHFHLFVSLALLAAYRDQLVFVPVVIITTFDHFVRGFLWPMSVFGVANISPWRPLEHAAWLLFLTVGLIYVVRQSLWQLMRKSRFQCSLKRERDNLESNVAERTAELDAAKQFQESVLNSIDAHICILDSDRKIVFVNQRWLDFVSCDPKFSTDDCYGRNYLDTCNTLLPSDKKQLNELIEAIDQIVSGDQDGYLMEYRCGKATDSPWMQVRLNRVVHDGATAVAVVHVDISQMKAAQARADGLAKIFLESPNELYLFDKSTLKFLEVNAGALNNLGYTIDEVRKMTPLDIKPAINEKDFELLLKKVNAAGGKSVDFDTVHQRKDGSKYNTSISLHEATLQGEPIYVAFVTDVTERIQMKNRLLQSQKLESMGQLAAGIAHEINTPMQCVFSNVEFLQDAFNRVLGVTDRFTELLEHTEIDWSKERETLNNVREKFRYDYLRQQTPLALEEATDASKRVISIVRAMKAMSHPGTAEKTNANINDLIVNAATITRNRWKYVAEVSFDFDPNISQLKLLPAEMSQVFINLLVNAADSIGEKLGQEPEQLGTIHVSTRKKGQFLQIDFADSGVGIPEHVHQKIFDPFFTTKEVGKGTGQGLSITYDVVVNKHNGAIDLTSTPGEGATFTLCIPIESNSPTGLPIDTASAESLHPQHQ